MATDNKPNTGKKFTPSNLPGDENQPKNKPRFNIYWIYAIAFAALIGYQFLRGAATNGVETNIQAFKQMLLQGDVDEYKVITNNKQVRIYVKLDSLKAK